MDSLLQALLRNESGGRNVTNVNATTSSGRARGYFQITDGTWKEFGGDRYAPTALEASYDQQADIASKIPLNRWDVSTIALMRSTGKPIDTSRTLGENLAANGETFVGATADAGDVGGLGRGQIMAQQQRDTAPIADTSPYVDVNISLDDNNDLFDSPLADALANSVKDRRDTGTGMLKTKPKPDLPTLDYASAVPAEAPAAGQEPSLPAPTQIPNSELANLFQVADIGGADLRNARLPTVDYGQVYPRRRREA